MMKFFGVLLIVSCLLVYNSQPTSTATTGRPDDNTNQTVAEENPSSHAVIRITDRGFLLGEGVAIGDRYIVTSAKCVEKYQSSKILEVVLGVNSTEYMDFDENAQIREVSKVTLHPNWASSKKESENLAILELSSPLTKTAYVGFSSYGKSVKTNDTVRVVGYGDKETKSYKILKVKPEKECPTQFQNTTSTFCANEKYADGNEFIFSDTSYSGAPIVSESNEDHVYGVVSSQSFGTLIRLDNGHGEWIETETNITRSRDPLDCSEESSNSTTTNTTSTTPSSEQSSNSTGTTTTAESTNSTITESTDSTGSGSNSVTESTTRATSSGNTTESAFDSSTSKLNDADDDQEEKGADEEDEEDGEDEEDDEDDDE